ncbi:helix-turn-helix domain-containing protein [Streptomyces sp. DT24]|uniref:helix-turn-helix domain-containing protein n=1 Tax=Streptomyces sp. DT24 TaxID=3416520 RepID=UPI003CF7DAC3
MASQHSSAPPRPSSGIRRAVIPSGVVHANSRHANRYTVIGNHLAQHRELSLVAVGLAVHIQSLPAGAKVGIKVLAERYPESETRIAAALRELETHGYLSRTRDRLPSGRVVTRTVSYNQPGTAAARPAPTPASARPSQASDPAAAPAAERKRPTVADTPVPPETPKSDPEPCPVATPAPTSLPMPTPAPSSPAAPASPPPPPKPRSEPHIPGGPPLHRTAADLLADLRRYEPRLVLAERDVHRLAPAVATWLERGTGPDAVRHALTGSLPEPLKHPAGFLAHRLAAQLPPALPKPMTPTTPTPSPPRPDPFQDCEGCDRPFRAPEPGHCRDCRAGGRPAPRPAVDRLAEDGGTEATTVEVSAAPAA